MELQAASRLVLFGLITHKGFAHKGDLKKKRKLHKIHPGMGEKMPKRLVICFDGTWNSADSAAADTNVVRISRAIHATHKTDMPQSVLYLRGVGSAGLQFERIVDGALGQGVDENIRSGYMFLCQNYIPGDEIFLFGFSRGAFTARSLAGLVGSCGLLARQSLDALGKAWTYYRTETDRLPSKFAQRHNVQTHDDVRIKFVGVWDTVGALGVPSHFFQAANRRDFGFHDTTPSRITDNAFHAMAIDEFRDEFVPTLWTGVPHPGTRIRQVWFAGAHSDVGGGYRDRALADIPLIWMAERAQECGLAIDWDCLPPVDSLNPLAPMHDPRHGWSLKDRLTPTFREICQRPAEVERYETLYQPRGADGEPLQTINEAIHPSVAARITKKALISPTDNENERSELVYFPRTIEPLCDEVGRISDQYMALA